MIERNFMNGEELPKGDPEPLGPAPARGGGTGRNRGQEPERGTNPLSPAPAGEHNVADRLDTTGRSRVQRPDSSTGDDRKGEALPMDPSILDAADPMIKELFINPDNIPVELEEELGKTKEQIIEEIHRLTDPDSSVDDIIKAAKDLNVTQDELRMILQARKVDAKKINSVMDGMADLATAEDISDDDMPAAPDNLEKVMQEAKKLEDLLDKETNGESLNDEESNQKRDALLSLDSFLDTVNSEPPPDQDVPDVDRKEKRKFSKGRIVGGILMAIIVAYIAGLRLVANGLTAGAKR